MSFNPLRSIANFRRSWRLLKVISSSQNAGKGPDAELELMLARSSREAFGIHEQLARLQREQSRANGELRKHIDTSKRLQKSLASESDRLAMDTAQAADKVGAATNRMESRLDETQQVLQSLRDFTLEQQNEIRRLRAGYDYTVIKTFALRMIHALEEASEKIGRSRAKGATEAQLDELQFIHDLFLFALEGSGIERFIPEIGAGFDPADPKLEPIAVASTDNEALHLTIARVIKPGFRIYLDEGKQHIIRPAQIEYLKFNNPTCV